MKEMKLSILVGAIVGFYPNEVQSLLAKNKIVFDVRNLSIDNLVLVTMKALSNSDSFRKDFYNLYLKNEKSINSKIENSDYLGVDAVPAPAKSTFDYSGLASSLLGGASTFFGSQNSLRAAQASADASIKQGQLTLEAQRLALEGKKIDAQTALALAQGKTGGNTMLYVGLGVGGVLILGLVIFAVTRKKAE